jgi:hypothetical protein
VRYEKYSFLFLRNLSSIPPTKSTNKQIKTEPKVTATLKNDRRHERRPCAQIHLVQHHPHATRSQSASVPERHAAWLMPWVHDQLIRPHQEQQARCCAALPALVPLRPLQHPMLMPQESARQIHWTSACEHIRRYRRNNRHRHHDRHAHRR